MSTATQRKAWNEAMRSAGAVLPGASAAGASGAASRRGSGGAAASGRASDRRRRRRDGARKSSYGDGSGTTAAGAVGGGGASCEEDEREYRVAIRMDALEGGTAADGDGGVAADGGGGADDDDEYDEFAQLDDDEDGGVGGGGGGRSAKRKRKARGSAAGGRNKSSVPKYLRPRSLASILIEEAGRDDSVAREYVNASVRRLGSGGTTCTRRVDPDDDGTVTSTWTKPRPPRKFCPVTGLFGEYTDPKSGIPYASLSALEQIRERPPPWMISGGGGSANYWEAVKSLQTSK